MPIIKSAKKRVKTANKAAVRNSKTKRTLKTALKSFHAAVTGKTKDAGDKHAKAQSAIDKTVKKGLVHKNKAARMKKQASAKAKAAGVKPTARVKAAPAKKAAAPKKTVAKKPVAKKAPAKKPVAKKK
ncbi:MAG: 30S ribosomal protein S20 [Patescibacteria group bacterium]|nr:30S ribosomal protein S20 [Patescibacteria group bacterium]